MSTRSAGVALPEAEAEVKTFQLGTLGPVGTSSEQAARFAIEQLYAGQTCGLSLLDSFEACIEELLQAKLDAVVVPHAYPKINDFYMHPELEVAEIFRADTPLYGLAVRQDFDYDESMLDEETVVSHPAPVPLIRFYMNREVSVELVSSTSEAARQVRDFETNLCVTNQQAADVYGLKFVKQFKRIPMSWTIFQKIKENLE